MSKAEASPQAIGWLGMLMLIGGISWWALPKGSERTSPPVDPAKAAIYDAAERITAAMKPCDDGYRLYRGKASKQIAESAAKRCLEASGTLGSITAPIMLSIPQKGALEHALKECVSAAGARYYWLSNLVEPENGTDDGKENAVSHNLLCINGLTDAANMADIASDDPRLSLPFYMGDK